MSYPTHQHVYRFAGRETIHSRICTGTQERFTCTVEGCCHVRLVMTVEGDAGLFVHASLAPVTHIPLSTP